MHLAARRNTMAPTILFAPSTRPSPPKTTPSITISTNLNHTPKAKIPKRPRTADASSSPKSLFRPTLSARAPSYDDTVIRYSQAPLSPLLPPPSLGGSSTAPNTPKVFNFFGVNNPPPPLPLPSAVHEPSPVSPKPSSTVPRFSGHSHDKGFLANMTGRLRTKHQPTRSLKIKESENASLERKEKMEKKEKKERRERVKKAYQMGKELWAECERDNQRERDTLALKNV
ncbi:hypothetical protein VKT23_007887 [Stygiomarasmius scandens]|uniref:BZIP domain-containing protein n=1 Tax=Marasmiellus scandens TaxID=2682957 RepID=A0ABR1JJI4_9AGAR